MESDLLPSSTPKLSSLRWKILRRAISSRGKSDADGSITCEEKSFDKVSRRTRNGFRLIPCDLMSDDGESSVFHVNQDVCFCYNLPLPNAPKLLLRQRLDARATLGDFEVSNQFNIDSTGLVCLWPSEEVLAYYSLTHPEKFRGKKVIELGSGYGLAGLVIAMAGEASEVVISDGNPRVVDYIQSSIEANSASFGNTKVKSMVLHWNLHDTLDAMGNFDIIVASDCTFFKEFHESLVLTIRTLLTKNGSSEAILFSPRRGDSLDKFLVEATDAGLRFTVTEIYDAEIWRQHQRFCKGDTSWPNYEPGHCYPLLISITF